jgi:transposase InsO family protein
MKLHCQWPTGLFGRSQTPKTRGLRQPANAFSKSWYNLKRAFALWFAYYNFCRIHQTLRMTPVMEAGLADHVWSIEELVALLAA